MCPLSSLPDSKQHCLANSSLSDLGACHKSRPLPQVQRRIVGWKPEAEQRLMKCIKLLSWRTHHRFCPPSASPSKRAWDRSFLTQSYIKCELWVLSLSYPVLQHHSHSPHWFLPQRDWATSPNPTKSVRRLWAAMGPLSFNTLPSFPVLQYHSQRVRRFWPIVVPFPLGWTGRWRLAPRDLPRSWKSCPRWRYALEPEVGV